jgi:hypothetical protein
MTTTRTTTRDWQTMGKLMANRERWNTSGALKGRATSHGLIRSGYSLGRLPGDWSRTVQARESLINYVVYSYATPIAWHDTEAGWVIPDEHYSVTTTIHQNRIRTALTYNGTTYAE